MMRCDIAQDAFQGADLDWTVIGNHLVMFAAFLCGDAQMGTGLARDGVAKFA